MGGAYALSKSTLNMLIKLYARENLNIHFCAFSPGLIDTAMQDNRCSLPQGERYPFIEIIRSKRNASEIPFPTEVTD